MHQLSSLSTQRGSGVTSVILFIMVLGIAVKLAVAIVPAQLDDRQLTKIIAAELKRANDNGDTARELIENTNKKLSINAYYDTKAEDIFTFTNSQKGQLAIYKKYNKTNNLFGNVDIVSRFEGDIEPITE
ncbi:DUF4845 domain-containing protein [uncultured Psychrobacter sp.]|uniref:DUF4845 domain-containing protein n=1 Tax=unclassified Psychrobacter TaxID=196806 RepID=UPI00293D4B5A|nr:DUF4845 domain-containing protein [uncultured Psychrobacter sp.]